MCNLSPRTDLHHPNCFAVSYRYRHHFHGISELERTTIWGSETGDLHTQIKKDDHKSIHEFRLPEV